MVFYVEDSVHGLKSVVERGEHVWAEAGVRVREFLLAILRFKRGYNRRAEGNAYHVVWSKGQRLSFLKRH